MTDSRSSTWRYQLWSGVAIFEFGAEATKDVFTTEEFRSKWRDAIGDDDVKVVYTLVEIDEPFSREVFETLQELGRMAVSEDVEYWSFTASGTKKLSLKSKLSDVDGLTVQRAKDQQQGMAWSRQKTD